MLQPSAKGISFFDFESDRVSQVAKVCIRKVSARLHFQMVGLGQRH